DIEGPRVYAVSKRVVKIEQRRLEQLRLARVLDAITLQRAEGVGISELGSQVLEDGPVSLLAIRSKRLRQVVTKIVGDGVVVQKGVVDVKEESYVIHGKKS